jgi:uncharacterized protein YpuA (DUF1002 family)
MGFSSKLFGYVRKKYYLCIRNQKTTIIMKVNVTKKEVLAKLKEVADNYENMIGVELTEEDVNDVIRCMNSEKVSLNVAAKEIVEGILSCLFREIK